MKQIGLLITIYALGRLVSDTFVAHGWLFFAGWTTHVIYSALSDSVDSLHTPERNKE